MVQGSRLRRKVLLAGCGHKALAQSGHPARSVAPSRREPARRAGPDGEGRPPREGHHETIGVYFGHAIAYYARFYDIRHVLIMGRVTSGKGGGILLERARDVLQSAYPELGARIRFHIPDESSRRVGQAIAAASLPECRTK